MTWTLPGRATYESVIKNSVFRASAAPVEDEAAAMAFFRDVAVLEATHNCWAFKTGQRFRCSDDGEPGGTAGRPILSAIEGQDFDNVMIVVTRWYGGVQLGAGGWCGPMAARRRPVCAKQSGLSGLKPCRCAFTARFPAMRWWSPRSKAGGQAGRNVSSTPKARG